MKDLDPGRYADVHDAMRELAHQMTLFASAAAHHLGLNNTDMTCLALLLRLGPMTAGQLADHAGLTASAITGSVDRLEAAGRAQRLRDQRDRRLVRIVGINDDDTFGALYGPMIQAAGRVCAGYTADELTTITRFARTTAEMLHDQTARLAHR